MANISIRTWEGTFLTLTELKTLPGVLLSTTVLINHRGVLSVHSLHYAASATTSFVTDIKSVYGATTIGAILRSILSFVVRTTTGRVRLLNDFCSKFPLIVSVTFSLPFLV